MMTEVPNQGLICFRGFFYQDRLLLSDPKALAEVLVTRTYDFEKPGRVRNFLRTILGDGLIIVEGDEHRFQRKNIMPVFSFRHIKELYPVFWNKSSQLVQGLVAELNENPAHPTNEQAKLTGDIEINHWANKVTMDIIGLAGLGREFNALKNSDDQLVQNYEEILEPTSEKVIYFAVNIILTRQVVRWLPWKINERIKVTTTSIELALTEWMVDMYWPFAALRGICRQLVRDKRAAIKARGEDHIDILSTLIKSNNFHDDQLVDQLLTFLAAG
jgi:cytochrome P450